MFQIDLLSFAVEKAVFQLVFHEAMSRNKIVDSVKQYVALEPASIGRIWQAAQAYCLLFKAGKHNRDETMENYVARVSRCSMAEVQELLDQLRPIPSREKPDTCLHQRLKKRSLPALSLTTCAQCNCLVTCSCSYDLVRSGWAYYMQIGQSKAVCQRCRISEPGNHKDRKRLQSLDLFYSKYGVDIISSYLKRALEFKKGKRWDEILSEFGASIESRSQQRLDFPSMCHDFLMPLCTSDPWAQFLIQDGIGFIPTSNKIILLREAENDVRNRLGIPQIGEGWVSEMILGEILKAICQSHNVTLNHLKKFTWLKRQHLDFYIPEWGVGIEYMGEQHYHQIDFFGGKISLQRTRERDLRKKILCSTHKIPIIYIRYDENLSPSQLESRLLSSSSLDIVFK